MSEATQMVMAITEVDGHEVLHVETTQPSYQLAVVQQLQPESSRQAGETLVCVTDPDRYVEVHTDTLRGALHSMGECEVTMELTVGGDVELRTAGLSQLTLDGTPVEARDIPARLTEGVVLRDFHPLYEGLRAAVDTAGVAGNEAEKCCVHLHLDADAMRVEGCNPHAMSAYEVGDAYDRAPEQPMSLALSVDCAARLCKMLLTPECTEVRIAETEDGNAVVQAGSFTMLISKQGITVPDLCQQRDHTYTQCLPVQRKALYEALRTLKGLRETQADIIMACDEVVLTGVQNRMGEARLIVPLLDDRQSTGIASTTTRSLLHMPLSALITACATCPKENEARVQSDPDSPSLCIDCGHLRMVVR